MGKTAWRPAPWFGRGSWLFTDGTIEQAPTVETTPSQRRWRISGTDMSVQKYDLRDKIVAYMQNRARAAGTTLWMELTDDEDNDVALHEKVACGTHQKFSFDKTPPVSLERGKILPIAFEFRHATYPLRAMIWVVLRTDAYGAASVSAGITYRAGDTMRAGDHSVSLYNKDRGWALNQKFKPDLGFELTETRFGSRPRQAAAKFVELLQQAQEVDTVQIPDGRDPKGRTTLEFQFVRSNYTQDFYRQLLDIVQSGPAMERLAEHLKGIRRELSNLGLVAQDKDGFDLNALLNGKLSEFQVQLVPQEPSDTDKDGHGRDPHHKVHLDLAHGVFAVSCNRHDLEEVAEQWNIAKFKAEVTGETDALLAYAEAYNDPAERARIKKIVNERRLPARGA